MRKSEINIDMASEDNVFEEMFDVLLNNASVAVAERPGTEYAKPEAVEFSQRQPFFCS